MIFKIALRSEQSDVDKIHLGPKIHRRILQRGSRHDETEFSKYQPDIVLANALEDRHPDHGKGAQLAIDACFLSGLRQIKTGDLPAWRPTQVYHYIQDRYLEPDFVIDISAHWDQKEAAIRAFKSQFFDPNSAEPASYISSPDFLLFIQARAMEMGHKIGVKYGEGFQKQGSLEVKLL